MFQTSIITTNGSNHAVRAMNRLSTVLSVAQTQAPTIIVATPKIRSGALSFRDVRETSSATPPDRLRFAPAG